MITTTASTTTVATLENAPTGLTGTVGVEVVDTIGSVVVIPYTTSSITEYPVGSGVYNYTFVTPRYAGNFLMTWGINLPLTPNNTFTEQLVITNTVPIATTSPSYQTAWRDVGDASTPQEIKRLRREMMDSCRRLGQPVVVRHMWSRDDVLTDVAKTCPACYVAEYDQTRSDCPVCFGIGFVSVENEPTGDYYIDTQGEITTDPATGVHAPRFGGFGSPYLTWLIEPDVAVDTFRINDQGLLQQTYDAEGVAPWTPKMGDNDLCINVDLDLSSFAVLSASDRFQLKQVQQVTIRGFGRQGKYFNAAGQVFLTQQTFRMNRLPIESNFQNVPYTVA